MSVEPVRDDSQAPPVLDQATRDLITQAIDKYLRLRLPDELKPLADKITFSLGYSDKVKSLLGRAAEESGNSPEVVQLKALALFLRALQAERQGQRVAILDADDSIADEITGIGVSDRVISHPSK